MNLELIEAIKSEYFTETHIEVSLKQRQGYRVTEDKIIFGTVITDKPDPEYLLHEMGHFVLFKDLSRLLISHYGLSYPQVEVFGQMYDHTGNWTDIKNEIRVICFQNMLSKKFNLPEGGNIDHWITSFDLLPGFTFVPITSEGYTQTESYEWVDASGNKLKYDLIQNEKRKTMFRFFEEESMKAQYSIEHFDQEWTKRVAYTKENLFVTF